MLASIDVGTDRVCLTYPPSGPRSCFPAPAADLVRFADLAPGDGHVDAFGGLAGIDVFRVVIERPGQTPFAFLPVPVPGKPSVKAWAVPVPPADVTAVIWYDATGTSLGLRPGPHLGPPPSIRTAPN